MQAVCAYKTDALGELPLEQGEVCRALICQECMACVIIGQS